MSTKTQLVFLRGCPGSGKTTFAQTVFSTYQNICADDYFMVNGEYQFDVTKLTEAHADCQRRVAQSLAEGKDTVVSNTFCKLWELQVYLDKYTEDKFDITIIKLTSRFQNVHSVPNTVVSSFADRYEKHHKECQARLDLQTAKVIWE